MRRPCRDMDDVTGSQNMALAPFDAGTADFPGLDTVPVCQLATGDDRRGAALDDENIGFTLVQFGGTGFLAISKHEVMIAVAGQIATG